jgi:uncharacterized protein YdeI (YjbR/CyaY-like superfamily)
MPSIPGNPLPIRLFRNQAAWLTRHGESTTGLWLKFGKGLMLKETVSYQEALEAALCHGWIDGQKKSFSESWWLQRFTPRGPGSIWSRPNRERAEKLIEPGKMRPAGLEAIERSRKKVTLLNVTSLLMEERAWPIPWFCSFGLRGPSSSGPWPVFRRRTRGSARCP